MIDLSDLICDEPMATTPTQSRDWSPFQLAIFDAVETTNSNLIIEAVAGSGKSTTIIEAYHRAKVGNSIFLAFNKSIADALATKGVNGKTFHSLGLQSIPRAKMDKRKISGILDKLVTIDELADQSWDLQKLIDLGRNMGIGLLSPNDVINWMEVMDMYDFDFNGYEDEALYICTKTLEICNAMPEIDFTDMLYRAVARKSLPKFDLIFVDESQDLSPIQHAMLELMHGRVVAVGDTHQAIYAFRGADSNSMRNLGNKFGCTALPLSISYRCPKRVVGVAQRYVPQIEAFDKSPDGILDSLMPQQLSEQPLTSNDMVICRNNAPLITQALRLLREKRPFNMRGDFAKQLLRFIKKFKAKDIKDFQRKLGAWYTAEIEKLEAKQRWNKIDAVTDKYEALMSISAECQTVTDLTVLITQLTIDGGGVTLSSIHRAKGLEAEHVYLLLPELIPSRYATQGWQLQQEHNLMYVAVTRAMKHLTFVTNNDPQLYIGD